MHTIQKAILFVLSGLVASKLIVQEQEGITPHSTPLSLNDDEGKLYRKPKGKCKLNKQGEVIGCTCENVIGKSVKKGKLVGVVCMEYCIGTVYCPNPPMNTSQKCIDFDIRHACGLECSTKKDCLKGAYCQQIDEPTGNVCMYKP